MSAIQTICDAFDRLMNDGAPCPGEPCRECPMLEAMDDGWASCQETLAMLLKQAASEPWECERREHRGSDWCSLCGGPLDPDDSECPTCGAAISEEG